ncbi:elongator complex protein 6 [Plakobranchus ocellatus]|uniref:Elongator complex protein 6 n=1 Tax=Plakobranchus ocellatus TaxID=259542 RepID=A0AAV4CKM6_9GAST|nr:elongator complex protein 6 [Plakobranchus ocellatus]
MLAQICHFLGVDSSNFPLNEHVCIVDRSKDAGFLIHYFLNLCKKQNRPLCVLGLTQSFNHYSSVAQKLGTNLLSARDNKNLIFIEGLQLLSDYVIGDQSKTNPFLQLVIGNVSRLNELIRESLESVQLSSPSALPPVVIIDDLSVLLSLGVPSKNVICFVKSLISLVTSYCPGGSLISSVSVSDSDSDEEDIWSCLSHFGTLNIEVSNLKSGYCKEVHGQVRANRY